MSTEETIILCPSKY